MPKLARLIALPLAFTARPALAADAAPVDQFSLFCLSIAIIATGVAVALWLRNRRRTTEIAALTARYAELEERAAAQAGATAKQLQAAQTIAEGLRVLMDLAPFPAWRRDDGLTLIGCNAAYARTVGSERDAVLANGLEIETAIIPDQAKTLAQSAQASGEVRVETRYFVVDGQRRALRIHEVPGLPDGGIAGFALDVTENEETKAELKRHDEAHAEVLNILNAAIVIFGPDKRVAYHNDAYARLWHLDQDWLATQPSHSEVLDALRENRLLEEQADYPAYKANILAYYTNLLHPEESLSYLPDGRVLRTIIAPHPFGGILLLFEDVTDRLALERSYNTLIAVQQETLENLYEGVAVYGGDGRLKLHNPTFANMWQLDEKLLSTEPHVGEIIDEARGLFDDGTPWDEKRSELIASVTDRVARTGRLDRPNASVIDFASLPLPDGNVLFTYLDVSDSVEIERALRERNEALETADRLKSEFIANVSYELRTPLNVIIGFAEVLGNEYFGELNERQKEYSEGILTSSHELLALINDILDLASIEAGRLELDTAPLDVHAALASVLALTRERARQQKLRLDFDCPADIGTAEVDERRIKQVLFSLLSNAVKFTPPGGHIKLAAEKNGNELQIAISDTGIGIGARDLELVFDKFHRGSSAGRRQGVGLGLSLVKSVIELHGGRVELQSEVNVGTQVTCRLPVRQPVALEEPAAE